MEKILIRFSFANEDLNMVHGTVFANILQYNYAKFVLFWPNYETLRGFNFEKLLKISKFSNLLNGKIISIE